MHSVPSTIEASMDQRAWALERLAAGRAVPVFREIAGDLDTPVSVYLKLRTDRPSFLLESVEGGEHLARYSFIGSDPRAVLRFRDGEATVVEATTTTRSFVDPLDLIAEVLAGTPVEPNPELPRFQGGAVGYLAYDVVANFERLPVPKLDTLGAPDGVFLFTDDLVVFDHVRHVIRIIALARPGAAPHDALKATERRLDAMESRLRGPLPALATSDGVVPVDTDIRFTSTQEEYERIVERAKEYIAAGDIIQVVPSVRMSRKLRAPPFEVYRALRRINPSPYMFYLDLGDMQIAGASPEMLVQCEGRTIRTRPIAGTRRRGIDSAEDDALARELLTDPKELAEHVMLVDLARNDVGRVAKPGSVMVDKMMVIEQFSHVMHIVSEVQGILQEGLVGIDALRACFPAGTLTGAPKIRAMEIIAELEQLRRGPYGGAVGYVSYSGDVDTAITIRTVIIKDGEAHVQAGGGIVADSDPRLEFVETQNKARAVMHAIDVAEEASRAFHPR